jgi:hypothetical protein
MASEEKKGVLFKLFGPKKSGCCSIQFEEVPEESPEDASSVAEQASDNWTQNTRRTTCCGGPPAEEDRERRSGSTQTVQPPENPE